VLNGKDKSLTVYLFNGNNSMSSRSYGEKDSAPLTVLEGLSIELGPVFTE
jgi:hypothetical protein